MSQKILVIVPFFQPDAIDVYYVTNSVFKMSEEELYALDDIGEEVPDTVRQQFRDGHQFHCPIRIVCLEY